jgi:4'-phosphopantetheinyl transferase
MDCLPPPGSAQITVFNPEEIPTPWPATSLSPEEIQRAQSFRFEPDRIRWSACRAALRHTLAKALGTHPAQLNFLITEFGKPHLAPPFSRLHFNLTHCHNLAAIILSTHGPVGIDVEETSRAPDLLECVETFCHPLEITTLPTSPTPRANELLRLWTHKEAVLKALGTGLSQPPQQIRIPPPNPHGLTAIADLTIPGLNQQRIHPILLPDFPNHLICASLPSSITRIDVLPAPLSTS